LTLLALRSRRDMARSYQSAPQTVLKKADFSKRDRNIFFKMAPVMMFHLT
jgi:hypothetical protein